MLVPLPTPTVPPCTLVRSTVLTSSRLGLREAGHFARYESLLGAEDRGALSRIAEGTWLPIALAEAHYTACDELGLSDDETVSLGALAGRHAQATFLSTIVRFAKGVGATPWSALTQFPRLWARGFVGGAPAVYKVGPKDARVEAVDWPLARIRYSRNGFRGLIASMAELLSTKGYVSELTAMTTDTKAVFLLSWV